MISQVIRAKGALRTWGTRLSLVALFNYGRVHRSIQNRPRSRLILLSNLQNETLPIPVFFRAIGLLIRGKAFDPFGLQQRSNHLKLYLGIAFTQRHYFGIAFEVHAGIVP